MGLGALVGLGSGIVFPHMHFMVLVGEDRGWGQGGGVRGIRRVRVGDCAPMHSFYVISKPLTKKNKCRSFPPHVDL